MKVRYPAKVKKQRKQPYTCDCSYCTFRPEKKRRDGDRVADEQIKEAIDDEELARISHIGAEITPCQPPQSWYDEDFSNLHESIKEADGVW